ncbi:MAG TPA: hypothetical protein VEZ90_04555 [Blastocatellia bacterium]|nr:hypothetical protein [Blastocatellia bacterium]
MRHKLVSLCLLVCLLALAAPIAAPAQSLGSVLRRGKNGISLAGTRFSLFDGPGILNYQYKHSCMPGPAGAVTVIGAGAGGGALVGTAVSKRDRKKGALIGAAAGAGGATLLWLYKNRTERRAIF